MLTKRTRVQIVLKEKNLQIRFGMLLKFLLVSRAKMMLLLTAELLLLYLSAAVELLKISGHGLVDRGCVPSKCRWAFPEDRRDDRLRKERR